ncbi:HNH endonuclease [Mycobacterium phage Typha]|uniref:HNH endonuclease n=1 Tax=Mycobacterium phage Typha TaxID=2517971 RepID=A0A482JDP6_9CAUD|nr:HNH endonuclease [Mycobacterium phage Typha]QBP29732.1 HNH endonuclease [Mycobacterium phage Typha]URM86519.1 HNH endonuclease [Mycobacterium phage Hilltopfarm]
MMGATDPYGLDPGCPIIPWVHTPKVCNRCGVALTGRRTQWCSKQCELVFRENHDWNLARRAARRRDGQRCVRCGSDGIPRVFVAGQQVEVRFDTSAWSRHHPLLEVNHKTPREGRGYAWGCHHHLEGLETLCRPHHQVETRKQAAQRRARQAVSA